MIRIRHVFKSFRHALRGVRVVYGAEQSFRVQVYAAALVLVLAGMAGVKTYEWIVLILLIGSVLTLELINSVFERLVDVFKPRLHPIVKDVKDIMAAAVLLVSAAAVVVGVIIFYPHVLQLVEAGA